MRYFHYLAMRSWFGTRRWLLPVCTLLIMLGIFLPASAARSAQPDAGATPDYLLGPGDVIRISVLHEDSLSVEVRISEKGSFSYPIVGEVHAAGKTTTELEHAIRAGLSGAYLMDPQVSVNIVEYRKFFIGGEVRSPGAHPYHPGLTINKAIAIAGGPTERASEEIMVIRENDPTRTPQKETVNSPVRPGDQIEVKAAGEIVVRGEVRKPAVYPYSRGMTVLKAISLAGGPSERASKTIVVIHEDDPSHTPIEVDLFSPVRPGDVITVEESFF